MPPSNPTVEPELRALVGAAADLYTARLPVGRDLSLRDRLERYNDAFEYAIESLAGLSPDGVLLACTGSSYLLGPEGDRDLVRRLATGWDFPVHSAVGAIRTALDGLGVRRLALISPYPAWLTQLSSAFWSAAGYEIVTVLQLAGGGAVYDVEASAVEAAVVDVIDTDVDAVLVTGTGAPTIEALGRVAPETKIPLLSSNLCGGWQLLASAQLTTTTTDLLLIQGLGPKRTPDDDEHAAAGGAT